MAPMPTKRSPSTLDALLSRILQRTVHEIAGAIREAAAPPVTAVATPAAPEPRKTPAKQARKAPAKKPAPAKAAPAKRAPKVATPGDGVNAVEKVLLVIRTEPGLRSEQIERLADLPKAAVQAALVGLRKDGRVTVQGKARGTTYAAV